MMICVVFDDGDVHSLHVARDCRGLHAPHVRPSLFLLQDIRRDLMEKPIGRHRGNGQI